MQLSRSRNRPPWKFGWIGAPYPGAERVNVPANPEPSPRYAEASQGKPVPLREKPSCEWLKHRVFPAVF